MKKLNPGFVPALLDPPMQPFGCNSDPELLAEWRGFRSELSELEAALSKEHPDYDWAAAMREHKDAADQAIRALADARLAPSLNRSGDR